MEFEYMKNKPEHTGFKAIITSDTLKRIDAFWEAQGKIVKQEMIQDATTGIYLIHSTYETGYVGVYVPIGVLLGQSPLSQITSP